MKAIYRGKYTNSLRNNTIYNVESSLFDAYCYHVYDVVKNRYIETQFRELFILVDNYPLLGMLY